MRVYQRVVYQRVVYQRVVGQRSVGQSGIGQESRFTEIPPIFLRFESAAVELALNWGEIDQFWKGTILRFTKAFSESSPHAMSWNQPHFFS
jgi:hypothetical protein